MRCLLCSHENMVSRFIRVLDLRISTITFLGGMIDPDPDTDPDDRS